MPISMYHASVPVFLQLLGGLKGVIEKAEAHATAHKWEENTLLNWRLHPDVLTFARQVRQASEHAFGAGRAAGVVATTRHATKPATGSATNQRLTLKRRRCSSSSRRRSCRE